MDLIRRAGLPEPLWNPRLYLGGLYLGKPDAWWGAVSVAVEVDSREPISGLRALPAYS